MTSNPSSSSFYYQGMKPRWDKLRAIEGGTETMREAGKVYLPQHPAEPDNSYGVRLARSTFHNYTMKTVRHVMNVAFGEQPKIIDSEQYEDILNNFSKDGRNLFSFLRPLYHQCAHLGESYVVVDMDKNGDGASAADNRRPFATIYPADSCIDIQETTVAGVPQIEHIRFLSNEVVKDGFEHKLKKRIRVIEAGKYQVWESTALTNQKQENPSKKADTLDFTMIEEGEYDADRVMVRRIRFGEVDGKGLLRPMFNDLADKNIEHWQSASDQRNILTMGRFPILYASGIDKKEVEALIADGIGPRTLLHSTSDKSKFGYVEPGGAAIEAGREDLKSIKEEMVELATKPFMPRTGNITATSDALGKSSEDSMINSSNIEFEDGVNAILEMFGEWQGKDKAPTINMQPVFGLIEFDAEKVKALGEARAAGEISQETYLNELKTYKLLADDFDVKKEIENTKDEQAEGVDDIKISDA